MIDRIISQAAFARLVQRYGGTDYRVPGSMDSRRWRELVELVGLDDATALVEYAKGDAVYIPSDYEAALSERYEAVKALHKRGMTPAQIALTFRYEARYSERQIWTIISGSAVQHHPRVAEEYRHKQLSLFDTEALHP